MESPRTVGSAGAKGSTADLLASSLNRPKLQATPAMRARLIEPGDLMVALGRRKNSSRQMALLIPRLRCFECGGRPTYWGPA